MNRRLMLILLLCGSLVGSATSVFGVGRKRESHRTSLVTVQGIVREISAHPGEGGLDVVMVTLKREDSGGPPFKLLLAPEKILNEIGFSVRLGDRLKARAFLTGSGYARAYKVLNLSRNAMVRFRSLHETPLWDNKGMWQGGSCRNHSGGMGGRGHGGMRGGHHH